MPVNEQKSKTCYALHVEYARPFVKHFFGVYSTAEGVVDALLKMKGLKQVPTSSEIKASFVASDVYHQTEQHITIWIGELPTQMVEYACGKLQRIREELLGP